MNHIQTAMRFPNPEDWCDQATAVKITGLSRGGLRNMTMEQPTPRLRSFMIGAHRLYWLDDVRKLADALKLIRRGGDAR